jgi:hypothetical protein
VAAGVLAGSSSESSGLAVAERPGVIDGGAKISSIVGGSVGGWEGSSSSSLSGAVSAGWVEDWDGWWEGGEK